LEYDFGDHSDAIPQAAVERVESGGVPPQFGASTAATSEPDLPTVVPQEELTAGAELPSKLIHNGHGDTDALPSVEGSSHEITAAAYFIAGKHEFDGGNFLVPWPSRLCLALSADIPTIT